MPVIHQPVITEKTMQRVPEGCYTFRVAKTANKIVIAKEIKRLYNVDVVSVRMINAKGKVKNFRRIPGKRIDQKKAIVTLKPGQKIPGFESGKEEKAKQKAKK